MAKKWINRTHQRHTTMKKVLTVVAIVAVLACLGGCKKKCNCVTTMNGQVVQTTTVESSNCAKLNVSQNVGGMVQEMKCDWFTVSPLHKKHKGEPTLAALVSLSALDKNCMYVLLSCVKMKMFFLALAVAGQKKKKSRPRNGDGSFYQFILRSLIRQQSQHWFEPWHPCRC